MTDSAETHTEGLEDGGLGDGGFGDEEILRQPTLKEDLIFRRHASGLSVYLCPKPGFQKRYACFATRFGSIDSTFRRDGGDPIKVPDGVAHFLEHQLFEGPQGNALEAFSRVGASCNAYTSFAVTNYLFSSSKLFLKNLEQLIGFVGEPYFTEESVEKEKGIIIQEMRMYEDNPSWQSFYGLLECLYHDHPIRKQIIGTAESVRSVDRDVLHTCYETFYHPTNMILFAIGDIDKDTYFEVADRALSDREYPPLGEIERVFPSEPDTIVEAEREIAMEVAMPRLLLGFKDNTVMGDGRELLRRSLLTDMLLEMLFGRASPFFERHYADQLIDDGFSGSFNGLPGVGHSLVGGDTHDPDRLAAAILEELERARQGNLSPEDFARQKRSVIGNFIRSFNSLEFIANHFCSYQFWGMNLFEIIDILHELQLEDFETRLRTHLVPDSMARMVVRPKATGTTSAGNGTRGETA